MKWYFNRLTACITVTMREMKQYILQRPVVRKSVSFPGLTKNSNQTSQQLVYTLGNISSLVLSGLLSDDVGPTDFIVHWI